VLAIEGGVVGVVVVDVVIVDVVVDVVTVDPYGGGRLTLEN
jgi:hypothetical protein